MRLLLNSGGMCFLVFIVLGTTLLQSLEVLSAEAPSANVTCRSGHMECAISKKCIPLSWKCDGDADDCGEGDNSDEENCPPKTCAEQEFRCEDGSCIPDRWKCDGEPDCDVTKKEDESESICSSDAKPVCESDEFSCGSTDRKCINEKWVCDGSDDCEDGLDEKNCDNSTNVNKCEQDMFMCANGQCISSQWICDFDPDCLDGSDETDKLCPEKHCKAGEFKCLDGKRCLSDDSWKCDGDNDCTDNSDELNCPNPEHEEDICSNTEFKCVTSGDCIHNSWKCDGDPDCTDESDELKCNYTCRDDQFKCQNNHCISQKLVCDHSSDCVDGSDEHDCKSEVKCEDMGEFDCYNDGSLCIPPHKVCDGVNDCQHREDESAEICTHKNPCAHRTDPCEEHAHCENRVQNLTKMEAVCVCDSGFATELGKCKDINECEEAGLCSQICRNTKGGYFCECMKGYVLEKKHNCRAEGDFPWLYYANRKDIRRIRVDNRFMEIIKEDTSNSVSLDIDFENNYIFWTDSAEEKIMRAQFKNLQDESAGSVLVTNTTEVIKNSQEQSFSSDGLAVDWLHKNIYWTENYNDKLQGDKIMMSNYDGTFKKTLFTDSLDEPRALSLDPEYGQMYWTDWGVNPKIERCGMDGTDRKVIVNREQGVEWPNGLTIDYVDRRIYWIDGKLHKIGSASMDGSDRVHVFADATEIQRPFGLSVFEDKLYWTDWHTNSIKSINKLTGTSPETVNIGSYGVMDIKVSHKMRQSTVNKDKIQQLCADKQCAHFCVPLPTSSLKVPTVTCLCGDNFKQADQPNGCVAVVLPKTTPKPVTVTTPKQASTPVPVVKTSTPPTVTVVAPQNKTETNVHPGSKDQNIGVIAAITAGIVAIILIVGFVVARLVIKRYQSRNKKSMNFDNPVYRKTTTTEEQCMITNDDTVQPYKDHHEEV